MGPRPQPACPAISVTKSHFKAPNKEPPAQHPFLLPDAPHRPPFPISLAVWRLSLRPIPLGQPLPAPVRVAPGSPGPQPRGWGLEAPWRVADPCSTSRQGGRGGGRQPQVRGAGAKRTHGPGLQEAAPVTGLRMQLHKAQGGGGRGGSACDRGAARDAGGAGLGPPPPPGEEARARG